LAGDRSVGEGARDATAGQRVAGDAGDALDAAFDAQLDAIFGQDADDDDIPSPPVPADARDAAEDDRTETPDADAAGAGGAGGDGRPPSDDGAPGSGDGRRPGPGHNNPPGPVDPIAPEEMPGPADRRRRGNLSEQERLEMQARIEAGRAFERQVLEALGEDKNTKGFDVPLKGVSRVVITDFVNRLTVGEIKRWIKLSFTQQMKREFMVAQKAGKSYDIYVSSDIRSISGPLIDAVVEESVTIRVFDQETRTFKLLQEHLPDAFERRLQDKARRSR